MATNTVDPRRVRRASRRELERSYDGERGDQPPNGRQQPLRGTPANENEPGAAAILSNLKRRPSTTPFWVAFGVSLVWIFGCMAMYGPTLFGQSNASAANRLPQLLTALVALFLPIGLAWTSAYLLYRAQQLRHVSEALMHTAVRLVRPQDIATESLSTVAQTIREEVNLLVSGVDQAVHRATQLEEIVHKEMASLERAFGSNEERIRTLIAGLDTQRQALQQAGFVIGEEATPLLGRLEENTQHLDAIINAAQSTLAGLEHGLKASTNELVNTIDEVASRAAHVGDQIGSQTVRMDQMSSVLLTEVQGFSEHITNQVESLSHSTGQMNLESTAFSQSVRSLEANMVQGLRQSVAELTAAHGEVQRSVDRMTSTLTEQLKSTSQQFTELLQTAGNNITYHLKSTSSEVAQQVERSGVEVSQQIQVSGDTLTQRLLSTSGDFVQNVARARSELFNYMEESSTAMTTRLEDTTNQLFGKIEQASGSLTTQLIGATQRVSEHLDQASTQMTGRLDDTTARLFAHIDRSNGEIFARLETASSEVSQKLEQAGNSMFVRIDTTARNLGERFDIATELLERVTTDITGRMEVTSSAFAETLDGRLGALDDKLSESRTAFDGIVGGAAAGIMSELGKTSAAFAAGLGQRTSEITDRFDTLTSSLIVKLDSSGGALMTALNEGAKSLVVKLDSSGGALMTALNEGTKSLAAKLNSSGGALLTALNEASRSLDANTDSTAARIDEAGAKFARHVATTNQFFAEQLGESAAVLDDRLEAISTQLTGKLEVTGTKLSERLETVSLLVDKSVERFNLDIEKVLSSREDVLGDLAGRLGRKAEDVDSMMRNYMVLIEESLDKADSRSREIGKLIANQADAASQNLEQQIKQLEDTSDAQIASAARQLREQYERAVNTMNEMLSMTAGEFTQTAQDMRVTAQQVVRDIDSTRNELRQAILDLPDETRSNSEAMRKVVADQIEALSTLADVVRRQSSGLDPGRDAAKPFRPPEGSAKTENVVLAAPQEWTPEAREAPHKRAAGGETPGAAGATVKGRQVSALLETETPKGSSDLLPQLRSEIAAAGPARGRKKTDANSVSRETESLVMKLNASARDLVEAIDGKLPADLERRFDHGEQHVYTHRLYQGRGKKMLELLTDRYQSERLMRGRIDAFARLFERLLDTVADTAQGEQLVDACLASESGKLYLMLAHASGRLNTAKPAQAQA